MENTKAPTLGNGKICYLEIPAEDIETSAAFYQSVFGWTVRQRSDGSTAFDDGIKEVSGSWVLGRKPSTAAGLLVSIMVDSLAETIEKIASHGGKLINQWTMGEHEVLAWFNDPAGNSLGIYQHPGGGQGKVCYLEIPAEDTGRSANFYKAVFNWPLRDDNHGDIAFDDGVGVVSGMWVTGRNASAGPVGLLIYIMVDDIHEAVAAVVTNGGKILQAVGMDAPEITARFSDPVGNVLGLYQEPG